MTTSGATVFRALLLGVSGAVALAAAVYAITTGPGSSATGEGTRPIVVTELSCAKGWTLPHSGQRALPVVNDGTAVGDVALVGATDALVYGEIEAIAPGTTRTLTAVLPPGRYQMHCIFSESATLTSSTVTVTGPPVSGAHPYAQLTYADIAPAVTSYRAAVTAGLATLATDTDRLRMLADAGQRAAAETAWLTAHLDYERLGAAYDTFGDYDTEIDGRPNGLSLGVDDPGWTGFLRLEYALWHNQPQATVASVADQLDRAVHALVVAFPEQPTMPNDLSLRTHEILENTLQFELTGESDQGSHTGLATALANVQGTEMTLAAIAPLLARYDPALLHSVTDRLHQLGAVLQSCQQADGSWPPVQSLTLARRQTIDASVGEFLETVAPVPDVLELPLDAQSP